MWLLNPSEGGVDGGWVMKKKISLSIFFLMSCMTSKKKRLRETLARYPCILLVLKPIIHAVINVEIVGARLTRIKKIYSGPQKS